MRPQSTMGGEFLRFLIVGATNTAVTWLLFFALVAWSGLGMVAANLIAWTVAIAWSFYWNRRFTFGAGARPDATQLIQFLAVNIGAVALSTLIVAALQQHGPWVAQAAATAVTLAWNYTLYRVLVFRSLPGSAADRRRTG